MARTTPLKIVIAYDSYTDGIRAWELSERLASRFRAALGVDLDLWKFDLLRDPNSQVRQASLAAVTRADLVMIAAGGLEHLPADVRDWVESWPPRHGGAWAALVASVGTEAQGSAGLSPMSNYLRQRAEHAGMEFFSNDKDQPVALRPILRPEQSMVEECVAAPAGNFGRQEPGW